MKKKSKSRQDKNRWKELSESLRELHPACEVCGSKNHLQVHHIVSKYYRKSLLRFNTINLIVVCSKCHFVFHKNPVSTMRWMARHREYDYNMITNLLGDI